ncbi:MAG TPA: hypothetical protein GXZ51_01715 [Acholeplasma sp.]|jgi:signal transduction histidine kinase|nr:hypothetical protein [Acholeplasma sp.]HKM40876.1 hypothetical protein [Patescibacteria group bacterium]
MKTEAVLKKNLLSIIGGAILVSGLIVAVISAIFGGGIPGGILGLIAVLGAIFGLVLAVATEKFLYFIVSFVSLSLFAHAYMDVNNVIYLFFFLSLLVAVAGIVYYGIKVKGKILTAIAVFALAAVGLALFIFFLVNDAPASLVFVAVGLILSYAGQGIIVLAGDSKGEFFADKVANLKQKNEEAKAKEKEEKEKEVINLE